MGDPKTGAFAAVHAGWRGTLATIVQIAVGRLVSEFGVHPANLRVAIGAAAGPCCYEVGQDVIDAFTNKFAYGMGLFKTTRPGHALVDLLSANRFQLMSAGVNRERIHSAPICTMCRTDLFFSYRKEKGVHGKVGRLMSVIGTLGVRWPGSALLNRKIDLRQFTFIVKGVGRRSTLKVKPVFSTGTFLGVSKKRKPLRSSVAGERGVLRSRSYAAKSLSNCFLECGL